MCHGEAVLEAVVGCRRRAYPYPSSLEQTAKWNSMPLRYRHQWGDQRRAKPRPSQRQLAYTYPLGYEPESFQRRAEALVDTGRELSQLDICLTCTST